MISNDMRDLFDQLKDGVTIIQDGEIIYVNNKLREILGYPIDELMENSIFLFATPEDKSRLEGFGKEEETFLSAFRSLEFWIVDKEGTRKYVRNQFYPLEREGRKTGHIIYTQDITREYEKETKIIASEFKKSKFLDFLSEHVIFHDTKLNIIWANKAASDSLDLAPDDIIGKNCYRLWHNRDEPCENCPVITAKETGFETTAINETPDGRIWSIRGIPVFGDDDSLIGMAELTREITASKIAEEAIKESEEKYRQIFQNAQDAIFIHKFDDDGNFGNFVEVNDLACQWTGYTPEELIGKTSYDISRRSSREVERNISNELLTKGESSFELSLISKDNHLIPVEINSTLFNLRGERVVLSIARNIADRKKAEEELRYNEEMFRLIFHNTNDAIFLRKINDDDIPGKFIEVNDVACQWTGFSREELLTMVSVDLTPPEKRMEFNRIVRNIMRHKSHNYEAEILTRDAEIIICDMSSHIIELKGERILLTFARNITERKKAEEELQESEEKFRQIFHNAQDAIFINKIVNGTQLGEIIEINNIACQWIGYSREEILGIKQYDSQIETKSFFNFTMDEEILTSGKRSFETTITSRNNKQIPVEIRSHLFELAGEQIVLSIARDITERKKAEEIIKESEERYRTLIETSPNAILLINLEDKITFANKLSAQMFGYDNTEDLIGLTPVDIVSREDFEHVIEALNKILIEGSIRNLVFIAIKKDGTRFPVELSATLLYDKDDKPRSLMGVIEDITERENVLDSLRENEEKFRQTFDQSNDGIILYDLKGNIIDVNHRVREQIGYSKSEMLSKTIHQLHPVTEQEDSKEAFEEIESEGYVNYEINFKRKDGTIFPAEVSSRMFEVRGEKFVQGVIRDITERKKAERELKESEEKFRQIFENAHDCIFLTSVNERLGTTNEFMEINDIACKLLNYSKEELLRMRSVDITAPEERAANTKIIQHIIKNGSGTFETRLITKDGIRIPVELSSHLFVFKDEKVILTIARDVSERKKAERDIQESEERYRKLVETSPDGILLTDIGGNILVSNLQIAKMYGTSNIDEMISINYLDLVVPEDRERASANLAKTLQEGTLEETEYTFRSKDGSTFPIELRSAKIVDNAGIPFAIVNVISDITERKETDKIKHEAFARIDKNIQDFDILVDRIRNPLMSIIGYAELADSFHSTVIIEEAEKINEITKQIDESWIESEEFRKILREHLLLEEEGEQKEEILEKDIDEENED